MGSRRSLVLLLLLNLSWLDVVVSNSDAWKRLNNKAYLEIATTMHVAALQSNCVGKQSHLVNIENINENNFVKLFNGGSLTWIGVSRNAAGNWTNWKGQLIQYIKWGPNQPCTCDAAVISWGLGDGEWGEKDSVSDGPFYGACERELVPGQGMFVQLLTSAGSDPVVLSKAANSRVECASLCLIQVDCGCFGYNAASKSCSLFKWQPTIQAGSIYYCLNEIVM